MDISGWHNYLFHTKSRKEKYTQKGQSCEASFAQLCNAFTLRTLRETNE